MAGGLTPRAGAHWSAHANTAVPKASTAVGRANRWADVRSRAPMGSPPRVLSQEVPPVAGDFLADQGISESVRSAFRRVEA